MKQNFNKTLTFNNSLKKKAVLESFHKFQIEEKEHIKYILLTINIVNEKEKLSIELISDFKLNLNNKNYGKLNSEIIKKIKIIKEYSNIENLNKLIFNKIEFNYKKITFIQYMNKEDYGALINKIIKRY